MCHLEVPFGDASLVGIGRQLHDPLLRVPAGEVDESFHHQRGPFLVVFLDVLGPRVFAAAARAAGKRPPPNGAPEDSVLLSRATNRGSKYVICSRLGSDVPACALGPCMADEVPSFGRP